MSARETAVLNSTRYRLMLRESITREAAVAHDGPDEDRGAWLARAKPRLDAYFVRLASDLELALVQFSDDLDEVPGVVAGIDGRDKEDSNLVRSRQRGRPFLVRVRGNDLIPDHDLELCIAVTRRIPHKRLDDIVRQVADVVAGVRDPAATAGRGDNGGRGWAWLERVKVWFSGLGRST
jgi:hypothetical protein